MRLDKLDLNLLVALNSLIELRSVTAAAIDLCLSQSAMSGALNRLRKYFDDPLLVPVGRTMQLTDKAEQLAHPVKEVLVSIRRNIMTTSQFDPLKSERTFSILASDYAYTVLIGAVLRRIETTGPNMKINIVPFSRGSMERFLKGELDVLLTIETPQPGLKSRHLYYDEHVVIYWNENRHVRQGLDLETFLELAHASVSFGPDQPSAIPDVEYAKAGFKRNVTVFVPTFSALVEAVIGTQRLATIQRRLADKFAKIYPITIASTPFELPRIAETVQWHAIDDRNQGTQWLISEIADTARCV